MYEIINNNKKIEDMIHTIRGVQVILDSDLATLYHCVNGTKTINQAVNRHRDRFPNDFMFQLTKEECNYLWSQVGTAKGLSMSRSLPYAFTEQGVAMLATILRTDIAAQVSIDIMRAFVIMKKYFSNNLVEQSIINKMVLRHDNDIKLLQDSFEKMNENIKNNHIFFDGQVYDAYSLMLDIFNKSKESIIIIDNYLDKSLLDILCETNKKIMVITSSYNQTDFDKYQEEYDNVSIKIMDTIHDRFIIIDNSIIYNFGASFKDLGKKCFSINKINDRDSLNKIMNYIN